MIFLSLRQYAFSFCWQGQVWPSSIKIMEQNYTLCFNLLPLDDKLLPFCLEQETQFWVFH